MRIRTKILLLVIFGAVVPLAASHAFVNRMIAGSMRGLIIDGLRGQAAQIAGRIDERLLWTGSQLAIATEAVPFESFSREELHRVLQIPYRQMPGATAVGLIDGAGSPITGFYRPDEDTARQLGRRPATDRDLAGLAHRVPLDATREEGVVFSRVHRSETGAPRLALAVGFPVAGGEERWTLVAELDLEDVCGAVAAVEGAKLAEPGTGTLCGDEDDGDRGALLEVTADVPLTGWRLTVAHPRSGVMGPLWRSLARSAAWAVAALLLAVLGGAFLARGITGPLTELERAAGRVAAGDYDQRLPEQARDETGRLAAAFNSMTAEIRAWNEELVARVEERTRELREAQQQIINAQKLAAVGELGAGVAHEINNPLTGMIGTAQLLQMEAEPGGELHESLGEIVSGGRRVAAVVDALLRFSQSQVAGDMERFDPAVVLDRAATLFAGRFEEGGIEVRRDYRPGCEINGVESELEIAFVHLLDNAVRAMPGGGVLRLGVLMVEGDAVRVEVADSGIGMSPEVLRRATDPFYTTAPPGNDARGVGLAVVQRVAVEHEGRVVLDSTPGEGTAVRLYFPRAVTLSKA